MLVRLFWPKCWHFADKSDKASMDGLWVEATREEAESEILWRLSPEQQEKSHREAATDWYAREIGNPSRPYCYLVAHDLSSIIPFNCRYPVHQMWNAYSPFGQFETFSFSKLEELKNLVVPRKVIWIGVQGETKSG